MTRKIASREMVGNYDLYNFVDGTAGLANDGRIVYFDNRDAALEFAAQRIVEALWPNCLYGYDVGVCEVVVYKEETASEFGAIQVCHAGDDRTLTVSRFFVFERAALDYACAVNLRHYGVLDN